MNSFYEEFKCFENFTGIFDYVVNDESMIELFLSNSNLDKEKDYNNKSEIIINDHFFIFEKNNFIIRKNKCLKKIIKYMIKSIFNQRSLINIEKDSNLYILNNICNYVLIGCSECVTLYNIKSDIIKEITNRKLHFNFYNEIEFITLLNIKNRKSSASWDFKQFIYSFLLKEQGNINTNLNSILENKLDISHFNKFLYDKLEIKNIKNSYLSNLLQNELINCWKVNNEEQRNYYLWKLLVFFKDKSILIYKNNDSYYSTQKQMNLLLFYFSLSCLILSSSDYSSYHFLKVLNISEISNLNLQEIVSYIDLLEKSSLSNKYLYELKTDWIIKYDI